VTFTPPSISGYNATPPSDDGAATTANRVNWSTIKTKLTDPIKAYVDSLITATTAGFTGLFMRDTETKSATWTAGTTDDGKFYNVDSTATVNLPPAASAGEGWHIIVFNNGASATITVDPDGSELINGQSTLTITRQYDAMIIVCNGTAFYGVKILGTYKLGTEQTVASATTTDIGSATTNNIIISGTTTITALGSSALTTDPIYNIRFSGALTLTHNATSLIIPGGVDITTAAGDSCRALYLGSGNWRILSFSKAARSPVKVPTRQYLTSGTAATYTTPTGCQAILVKMWGAGGGGGATTTNAGTQGGTTIFNSINAVGGAGGEQGGGATGDGGYATTPGTGSASLRIIGSAGESGQFSNSVAGGNGGATSLGGSGVGRNATAGSNAQANSGSGGGGACASGSNYAGGGGQAGEYAEIYIASPSATYTYTIGAVGAGGAAGTNAGGDGGTGLIIVEEFY